MDKIELINKMLSLNPKDGNAWYLLGLEHAQNHRISEALTAYAEALKYCDEGVSKEIITALGSLSSGAPELEPPAKHAAPQTLTEEENIEARINEASSQEPLEDTHRKSEIMPSNDHEKPVMLRVIHGKSGTIPWDEVKRNTVTFDDVGGLQDLKETIRMKIIKPFSSPGLFEKFKKKSGGGILLYGPPGCGKTFIAKATAGECRAQFIYSFSGVFLDHQPAPICII